MTSSSFPAIIEVKLHNEDMKRCEKEKKMAYVTTAERIGMKRGREEGREEQRRADARGMEEEGIPRPAIARVLKVTEEELDAILKEIEK